MNNVNGIVLITIAMAAFALEDMFIKTLSASISTGQILVVLGFVCTVIFWAMSLVTRKRMLVPAAWGALPMVRALAEAVGAIAFVTALARVELSTVAAVFQALPLVATMGAALFLGEQVGWRRWSAIGAGFIGVLMIIRPGLTGFQPDSLYVVAAVIAVAARDLITRRIDAQVASSVVAMQAYLALVLAGTGMMIYSQDRLVPLLDGQLGLYLGAVGFSVLGYYTIVSALRVGEASVVMPYRYTRLVFSILLGVLVFGERPDLMTLAGASLIIASGLYTFLRERLVARRMAMA